MKRVLLEVTHDIQSCFHRICIYWIVAFATKAVNLDNTTIKLEIWDTAGQEDILLIK